MPIRTTAFLDSFPLWLLCLASFALGTLVFYLMARKFLIQSAPLARQAVIDGILDPVIVLDSHHTLIAVNRAAEQILGLDARAIGQTTECLPPVCAALLQHHGSDEVWRQEVALTGEAGRRVFALTLAPFRQDQNDGRVLIGRDVTEERRLQESLAHGLLIIRHALSMSLRNGGFRSRSRPTSGASGGFLSAPIPASRFVMPRVG